MEISIYQEGDLEKRELGEQLLKLKLAFPKMPKEFFNILSERIIENRLTGERLSDAVNHLVDTYKYPTIQIADIISYDIAIPLYAHSDYVDAIHKSRATHEDFAQHYIDGKLYFVKQTDCHKYHFKPTQKKPNHTT